LCVDRDRPTRWAAQRTAEQALSPRASGGEQVCITADDYGLSSSVNEAVEVLAGAGRISAVSVMAHREAELASVRHLAGSGVAIGLHLCFTGERPWVSALRGPEGRLPADHRQLFAAVTRRPALVRLLRAEAEAQADRLAGAGVSIAFVNGHEHVHLFPALWPLAASLARRLGVCAVRCALGQPLSASRAGLLAAASRLAWSLSPLPGRVVLSPLGVGLAGALTREAAGTLLEQPFAAAERRVRELCFHPALDAPGRRAEHEMLASGVIAQLLASRALRMMRGISPTPDPVGARSDH
jgi:chitin disaccharide deacetylase